MPSSGNFEHAEWLNVMYTPQFLRFLAAKGFACKTLLDVGAHRGDWSEMFLKVYPGARTFMIEPLEEKRPELESLCKKHPGSDFICAGAGAASGDLEFTVWPSLSGSSFVPEPGERRYASHEKRTVPIVTVDDLIADGRLSVPEFVKADVQGFELEVLRGASSLMGKTEIFFLEVSLFNPLGPGMPLMHEAVEFMWERGYVVFDIVGFYRRRKDHALAQCDVAFVRRDSPLREYSGLTKEFEWDYARFAPSFIERVVSYVSRRIRRAR